MIVSQELFPIEVIEVPHPIPQSVIFTMPLPPEGTLEERALVLYSVHPSGAGVTIGRTFELVFSLTI
jgi:hypothetical protein